MNDRPVNELDEDILLRLATWLPNGPLLADLVHELGQPLFAIGNYAHAIAEKAGHGQEHSAAQLADWARSIVGQVDRAGATLKALSILLHRAHPVITDPDPADKDLTAAVARLVDSLQGIATRWRVSLEFEPPESEPRTAVARADAEQLVACLIQHAYRRLRDQPAPPGEQGPTPHGEQGPTPRRIGVGLKCVAGGVELSVSDTGPDVPDDRLAGLFTPLGALRPAAARVGRCSPRVGEDSAADQGLALCMAIMNNYSGSINAQGGVGRGLTIVCFFPEPVPGVSQQ